MIFIFTHMTSTSLDKRLIHIAVKGENISLDCHIGLNISILGDQQSFALLWGHCGKYRSTFYVKEKGSLTSSKCYIIDLYQCTTPIT